MTVLALESSTMLGSVAIVRDGQVLCEVTSLRERSHSEVMNAFVDQCLEKVNLKLMDIDLFATGQGPGSFTGIRVSANIAKTYSYCFSKPMASVDSLANMATLNFADTKMQGKLVMPMINAYKNMVYTGIYRWTAEGVEAVLSPTAIPVRELKNFVKEPVWAVGDGWVDYHEFFHPDLKSLVNRSEESKDYPTAATLGVVAERLAKKGSTLDWKSFVPLYIRASEAEETKKGIFITPLQ